MKSDEAEVEDMTEGEVIDGGSQKGVMKTDGEYVMN